MIRLNASAPAGDFVDALLECHERIRRFSSLSVKLATTPDVPGADVRDAAARVHRYFTVAFPLHVADEDVSLVPRLTDESLRTALEALARQHRDIEALLEKLVPAWKSLSEKADPAQQASTAENAANLERAMQAHLAFEENELFPRVRALLAPDVLATIRREQQARRS